MTAGVWMSATRVSRPAHRGQARTSKPKLRCMSSAQVRLGARPARLPNRLGGLRVRLRRLPRCLGRLDVGNCPPDHAGPATALPAGRSYRRVPPPRPVAARRRASPRPPVPSVCRSTQARWQRPPCAASVPGGPARRGGISSVTDSEVTHGGLSPFAAAGSALLRFGWIAASRSPAGHVYETVDGEAPHGRTTPR